MGPGWVVGSNPETSCCEVQTIAIPCTYGGKHLLKWLAILLVYFISLTKNTDTDNLWIEYIVNQ